MRLSTNQNQAEWRGWPIMIDDPTERWEVWMTWKSIVPTSGLSNGINNWGSENLYTWTNLFFAFKVCFKIRSFKETMASQRKCLAVYHFKQIIQLYLSFSSRSSTQKIKTYHRQYYSWDWPSSTLTLLGYLCLLKVRGCFACMHMLMSRMLMVSPDDKQHKTLTISYHS